MKNIHAFTETGTNYPGYISINEHDGQISITTRTRGGAISAHLICDRDQLKLMATNIEDYLKATAPAPTAEQAFVVTLNGKETVITKDVPEGITYNALCAKAGVRAKLAPTITWSIPNESGDGTTIAGQVAPVDNGAIYNVMVTNNA